MTQYTIDGVKKTAETTGVPVGDIIKGLSRLKRPEGNDSQMSPFDQLVASCKTPSEISLVVSASGSYGLPQWDEICKNAVEEETTFRGLKQIHHEAPYHGVACDLAEKKSVQMVEERLTQGNTYKYFRDLYFESQEFGLGMSHCLVWPDWFLLCKTIDQYAEGWRYVPHHYTYDDEIMARVKPSLDDWTDLVKTKLNQVKSLSETCDLWFKAPGGKIQDEFFSKCLSFCQTSAICKEFRDSSACCTFVIKRECQISPTKVRREALLLEQWTNISKAEIKKAATLNELELAYESICFRHTDGGSLNDAAAKFNIFYMQLIEQTTDVNVLLKISKNPYVSDPKKAALAKIYELTNTNPAA